MGKRSPGKGECPTQDASRQLNEHLPISQAGSDGRSQSFPGNCPARGKEHVLEGMLSRNLKPCQKAAEHVHGDLTKTERVLEVWF